MEQLVWILKSSDYLNITNRSVSTVKLQCHSGAMVSHWVVVKALSAVNSYDSLSLLPSSHITVLYWCCVYLLNIFSSLSFIFQFHWSGFVKKKRIRGGSDFWVPTVFCYFLYLFGFLSKLYQIIVVIRKT